MIEYLNDVTDPERPWAFIPDTEGNILDHLARYTLDPTFEGYGDFVNRSPGWTNETAAKKYKGCALISGNFLTFSHAFRLVTDDEGLISRISEAINRNKATPEYQAARGKKIKELNERILWNEITGKPVTVDYVRRVMWPMACKEEGHTEDEYPFEDYLTDCLSVNGGALHHVDLSLKPID